MTRFESCLEATTRCVAACESCATECGASGDRARAKCAAIGRDCADVCRMAEALMLRGSPFADAACLLCAQTCEAHAAECAKFLDEACCQDCLKACRACAKECRASLQLVTAAAARV